MMLRHFLSWKPVFYGALLPALRKLAPARADAILSALGRLLAAAWPPRRHLLIRTLERAQIALNAGWNPRVLAAPLAANSLRFLARDCLLEGATDAEVFARFKVEGFEHLTTALAGGR
ncbi:MAG TPA: hypothetical protein VGY53_04905, partial [Isosphaeraceae bacterium]|nr:hypothetical protein [Isosphaeraceae bacterium]